MPSPVKSLLRCLNPNNILSKKSPKKRRDADGESDGFESSPEASPGSAASPAVPPLPPVGPEAAAADAGPAPRNLFPDPAPAGVPPEVDSAEVQRQILEQVQAANAASISAKESSEIEQAIAQSLLDSGSPPQGGRSEPFVSDAGPLASAASSSAAPWVPPTSNAGTLSEELDQVREAELRALNKLNELVANCLESNVQFVDPSFVPGPKVLYQNGRCRKADADNLLVAAHYEKEHGRQIQWRRPGEILQRPDDLMMEFESREEMIMTMHQMSKMIEWRVFQSNPLPTDISQGAIGNCWFCGSLAAVAEKPNLIKRLFVDDCSKQGELSPVGVYLVRLCDGGEWQFVQVDDNFPCNTANMLAYSGARRNQLWVPLVEKAFAKIRTCYEETEGGNPSEGLRLFTGWPSIVLHLQKSEERGATPTNADDQYQLAMRVQASCPFIDDDLLWIRLQSARSANLIICGSCGHVEGLTKEQYRERGLSPSHCYSIVHVVSVQDGVHRLLKLRNPWGTGLKWKGDFSDGDTEHWTPEVKAEIGAPADDLGKDGGLFWMTLPDVRKYFNSITICPYQEGWSDRHVTATFPTTWQCAQPAFHIGKTASGQPTEALVSLMQPEERQTLTTMTADLGVALLRVPAADAPRGGSGIFGDSAGLRKRLTFVDSIKREVHDTTLRDIFFEEGESSGGLIAVPLCFNQRTPSWGFDGGGGVGDKKFSFSFFSAREVPVRGLQVAPEVVRDALVGHVKRRGAIGSERSGVKLYKHVEAGLVVYLENASTSFVELTVDLTELFNMTISRGAQGDASGQLAMHSKDIIPPMHGMVVFVAAAMPAGHTYRFSSRFIPLGDAASDGRSAHSPPLSEPCDPLHGPFFLEGLQPQSPPMVHGAGRGFGGGAGRGRGRGRGGRDEACEQQ